MKVKAVIFDMDGTVLYTLEDLYLASVYALKSENLPERTIGEIRRFVGNGLRTTTERCVPAGTPENTINAVCERFNAYYDAHCTDNVKPYDGIIELLEILRKNGIKTAVVSNKSDYAVKRLSEKYFGNLFDMSLGSCEEYGKKPDPKGVLHLLDLFGVKPDEAVYVGDSEVDIETARNAKMPCISVTWGYRDRELLEKLSPAFVADNPEEIAKTLEAEY